MLKSLITSSYPLSPKKPYHFTMLTLVIVKLMFLNVKGQLHSRVVLISVVIRKALFMESIAQPNAISCPASLYNASVQTDHTVLYQLILNRFVDFYL